jgi:hypothetical protein
MSTLVTVFVCDEHNRGLFGYKVKQYGDDTIKKTQQLKGPGSI